MDFCGPRGSGEVLVYIAGRSFFAKTGATGAFILHYVPPGTYDITIEIPGQPPHLVPNVSVTDNHITDLGPLGICPDSDGDGYNASVDCDDNNPNVHPGAAEICGDGIDNNCDGQVDEGCTDCTDADKDGYYAQAGCGTAVDCDDSNPSVNPGAAEVCNGIDDNCNGLIDEGLGSVSCGVGACFTSVAACIGGVPQTCVPGSPQTEVCNGIDDNCNGLIDEGGVCGT